MVKYNKVFKHGNFVRKSFMFCGMECYKESRYPKLNLKKRRLFELNVKTKTSISTQYSKNDKIEVFINKNNGNNKNKKNTFKTETQKKKQQQKMEKTK